MNYAKLSTYQKYAAEDMKLEKMKEKVESTKDECLHL